MVLDRVRAYPPIAIQEQRLPQKSYVKSGWIKIMARYLPSPSRGTLPLRHILGAHTSDALTTPDTAPAHPGSVRLRRAQRPPDTALASPGSARLQLIHQASPGSAHLQLIHQASPGSARLRRAHHRHHPASLGNARLRLLHLCITHNWC